MTELAFPMAALLLTFGVLMPACTAVARAVLGWERSRRRSWSAFGSERTLAWIAAPTVLPLVWLMSAALHQSERMGADAPCLVEHGATATTCRDAILLFAGLLLVTLVAAGLRALRDAPRLRLERCAPASRAATRVAEVAEADSRLAALAIHVVRAAPAPVCTVGWLRPTVFVDACFVERSDDDMLRAALLHEWAHVRGRDTFRASFGRWCLMLNPTGRWLRADFLRWEQAREAQCDAEAVHAGGKALALAESIVFAARFTCAGSRCGVALCGHDRASVRLRLALLLDGPDVPVRTLGHVVLMGLTMLVCMAPHLGDAGWLEMLHFEVERLAHLHG